MIDAKVGLFILNLAYPNLLLLGCRHELDRGSRG